VTEIYSWFEELAEESPSYVTVWRSIGETHYGRDIMAAHITDSSESLEGKMKVYFQCLLHARTYVYISVYTHAINAAVCLDFYNYTNLLTGEWISGPICMYIARYFANPDPSNEMVCTFT